MTWPEKGPKDDFVRDHAREVRQETAENIARQKHEEGNPKESLRFLEIATHIAREVCK